MLPLWKWNWPRFCNQSLWQQLLQCNMRIRISWAVLMWIQPRCTTIYFCVLVNLIKFRDFCWDGFNISFGIFVESAMKTAQLCSLFCCLPYCALYILPHICTTHIVIRGFHILYSYFTLYVVSHIALVIWEFDQLQTSLLHLIEILSTFTHGI